MEKNLSTNLFISFAQGTRMEERLDDAINVLRSHCEPQLNMPIGASGMDGAIGSTFANVPTQPQSDASGLIQAQGMSQDSVALPIDLPVKIERPSVPSASSEFL
jgi:transcription factor 4/12